MTLNLTVSEPQKLIITVSQQNLAIPRLTTAEKEAIASPSVGMEVFDLTLMKKCVYTTTWETIQSV